MLHLTTHGARVAIVLISECLDERWKMRRASTLAGLAHTTVAEALEVAERIGLSLTDGTSGETWIGLKDRRTTR